MTPAPAQQIAEQKIEEKIEHGPQKISPFTNVTMPPDGVTIGGNKYYGLEEISRHTGLTRITLQRRCHDGTIKYITKPLSRVGAGRRGTFLISAEELRRFLSGE